MTHPKTYFLFPVIFFIGGFSLFSSCGNKWKKTTDVTFRFSINQSTLPDIHFDSGYLILNRVGFSGDRKQGEAVDFDDESTGGKNILFQSDSGYPSLLYSIPQGTYKQINLEFETNHADTLPNLVFSGIYSENDSDNVPIRFEFSAGEIFKMNAVNSNNGAEIKLFEGKPATVKITFDVGYWFETVTNEMLDDAGIVLVNNVPTIVIAEKKNSDIYVLVAARVGDAASAIFQ